MRHYRKAPGLMDQFDGFQRGHLGLGHPGGAVFLQEPLEGFIQRAAMSAAHQRASDMRTTGRAAIRQREDVVSLERNAQRVDARDHVADAFLPDFLKLRDLGQQLGILRINEVSQNVQFVVAVFCRQFRADDKLNARRRARRRHARATLDRIVIGKGERLMTKARTMPHDFLGREGAVGKERMEMEVGEHR